MKNLILLTLLSFFIFSCEKQTIPPPVTETHLRTQNVYDGTEGDQITMNEGEEMIARWRENTANCNIDTSISYNFIGRDILLQLLNQSGCAGISFYYGLDSLNRPSLVYVGTRYDNTDIESVVCDRALIGVKLKLIGKGLSKP